MIRYFDRYARIAEKLVDPNLPRVNSRMDLDYLDDMRVGFRVQKSHYKGWENLEAPRESILFPNADKRWADGDWFDCISIEGPADSLGPNTINAIRKFTSITLAALK